MDLTERAEFSDSAENDGWIEFLKKIPDSDLFQKEDFIRNTHADAQWFPGAGLGLFLHWGISSVAGHYDLSWGMIKRAPDFFESKKKWWGLAAITRHVPPTVYWKNAEKFDASHYEPDKWLSAAAKAGFKYAVLTTKHHDGFVLWPSEHGEFNTRKYLNGRDLVREYVDACRKNNLKVGFYFSPPDWYMSREYMNYSCDPSTPCVDYNWEPVENNPYIPESQRNPIQSIFGPVEFRRKIREYNRLLLEELLTNYGQIDLLWFDGPGGDCITVKRIRELQPQILINSRGRRYGDFNSSAENAFPDSKYENGWWDYCTELSDGGWGYLSHEIYRPTAWFLAELAKTRSWGGNFLVNVGPDCHGELPEVYYKRMNEISEWMQLNSESVFDVEGTDLWPSKSNVPVTKRDNVLYLHVHWFVHGSVEISDIDEPVEVTLENVKIPYEYEDRKLKVDVPYDMSSILLKVIEVTL